MKITDMKEPEKSSFLNPGRKAETKGLSGFRIYLSGCLIYFFCFPVDIFLEMLYNLTVDGVESIFETNKTEV